MPELPEVETITRCLADVLVGRALDGAEMPCGPVVRCAEGFGLDSLTGRRVTGIERRGKLILVTFQKGLVLAVHLKMTGQLLLEKERLVDKHTRVLFHFGTKPVPLVLRFRDVRKFGRIVLMTAAAAKGSTLLGGLGPDALTVSPDGLIGAARSTRRPVKALLLDQTKIAGIGNIYADEILHRSKLHPLTPSRDLTEKEVGRLASVTREVLAEAIEAGGSSVRDYLDAGGSRGSYQERHAVYRRHGQACTTCSTTLARILVSGRGTHFCPSCQPAPRRRRHGGRRERREATRRG